MMSKYSYLLVYTLPITVFISFFSSGIFTFTPMIIYFGFVPLIELFIAPDSGNLEKQIKLKEKESKFYDWIIYLIVPIQIITLLVFLLIIQDSSLTTLEITGKVISMGISCGVLGLNVGHELGHRHNRTEQFLGELLLLSSLNAHFLPYHNGGHHLNVATPKDAATARRNEFLPVFWIRSHFGSYAEAWKLEFQRMKSINRSSFSFHNRMVVYSLANLAIILSVYLFFNLEVLLYFLAACTFGIVLLETVNYIEHYGLLRKKVNGRYERVKRTHSWNSDHLMGRSILFNLSRHSDHHYNGSKKYQLLDSLEDSPQMPTGYPGMMILSLIQPLWFKIMNDRLEKFQKES